MGLGISRPVAFLPISRLVSVHRDTVVQVALAEPAAALVVLHGPAGVGKTIAMGQIATRLAELGSQVVWVQLRPDDSGRDGFWQRVLSVLDNAGALEDSEVLSALSTGGLIGPPSVGVMIEAFAQRSSALVIALNDFDSVAHGELERDLVELMIAAPRVRILVSGRSLGSLSRPSTRSRVPVRAITESTLAFTPAQTEQLVQLHNPTSTPEQAEATAIAIHRETGGWALATMALSLDAHLNPSPQHTRTSREFVREYVARLLAESSPEELRVLLLTSLIDEVSPSLASLLTLVDENEVSRILERVASVVELPADDTHEKWYRHHDLVREELRARAEERLSADDIHVARLTIVSAITTERPSLATRVAIEAKDWKVLEDVLKESFASFLHANTAGFDIQPTRIPPAAIAQRPVLHAVSLLLQCLVPRDPLARVKAGLTLVSGRALDAHPGRTPMDRVVVSGIRMVATRFLGDADSAVKFALASSADMTALSEDDIVRYAETLATINTQKAATYIYTEDFGRAQQASARVLTSGAHVAHAEWAHAHALTALTHALKGDMPATQAATAACEAIDLPYQWRDSLYASNYRVAGALVRLELDDAASALAECRRVDKFERNLESWPLLAYARALTTESLMGPGEALVELERTIASHRIGLPTIAPLKRVLAQLRARLRWKAGLTVGTEKGATPSLALAYSLASRGDWERMTDVAVAVGRDSADYPRRRSEALLLQANGALNSSNPAWAIERFTVAANLMRTHGLTTPSRALHSSVYDDLLGMAQGAQLEPVAAPVRAASEEPQRTRPLTAAELRTLEAVYRHDSVEFAAQSLFVTAHTVRGHLKSSYRKLGVHSRADAARLAIELGYFSPR